MFILIPFLIGRLSTLQRIGLHSQWLKSIFFNRGRRTLSIDLFHDPLYGCEPALLKRYLEGLRPLYVGTGELPHYIGPLPGCLFLTNPLDQLRIEHRLLHVLMDPLRKVPLVHFTTTIITLSRALATDKGKHQWEQ